MLPDVYSKHVLVNCNSTGIYSQNITSSSGPTRVSVRDLRRPGFHSV